MSALPAGHRVVVPAFAESPLEGVAAATLEPMDAPDPSTLARGDVIVRVKSAAVGWVDLLMTSGQYQHMAKPPYTPGIECAGTIAWVGPDVRDLAVGDDVIVDGFLAGPRSLGAYQRWGGFATYVVAPSSAVVPMPPTLSHDQAAALLGSYETAYHCLVTRGRVQAGETVLIHGASGATGLAAVQIAKLLGARVIATGRSEAKLAEVKREGADDVIVLRYGAPDAQGHAALLPFRDEVKALTGGRGVDVVYDGVGGDISLESLRCVRFGARFLIVGWASTPDVAKGKGERGAPRANVLPTNLVMMKSLDVLGCPTAISSVMDPSSRPPRMRQILAWASEGRLAPRVSHTYPLASFREAMIAKWNGEVLGGCVLHP
ncbi:MAG: NADPH:quinone oxidoreductase family protein [Sandaracinaceae bacterium]|nr:NADPH:quinone oxidoreductase family protein [Sandaracinaceae bacterium]